MLDNPTDRSYINNMKNKPDVKLTIIEKAYEIMHQKGYNGTGIQEIVDAAGIAKGSFYHYFKSKEQLAIEAAHYYAGNSVEMYNLYLTDKSISPLERIRQLFTKFIDHFINEYNCSMGCFIGNLCQEMADTSPAIAKAVDSIVDEIKKPLIHCLDEAQNIGEINSAKDTSKLAEFIINSWEGAVLRMKSTKSPEPLNIFKELLFDILLK